MHRALAFAVAAVALGSAPPLRLSAAPTTATATASPTAPTAAAPPTTPSVAAAPTPAVAPANMPKPHPGCLPTGDGYLRARIRGAMNLDIDWHNAEIDCEGGMRPDGSALRVSFAGPVHSDGRRLRLLFGVGSAREGRAGHALPTNLTVIFEGEQRLFATRGNDHCTVDDLQQQRLGALGGPLRTYRIVARGFCISPASTLDGSSRILVSRFDFAGNAAFEDVPAEKDKR